MCKRVTARSRKHQDEWLDLDQLYLIFYQSLAHLKNKNIIYAWPPALGWTLGAITGKIISRIVNEEKTNLDLNPYSSKRLIRKFLSKNYLAYTFSPIFILVGKLNIGKFATLFEVPPLILNSFRWVMVWLLPIPFTIKEILVKRKYIKENFSNKFMGILTISTFNSVVYFALNFTQVINAVLMLAAIPPMIIFSSIMKIENAYFKYRLILSILGVGQLFQMQTFKK